MVGVKAEEEKEEEAQRDSYLLLSLFLLFSCPPSPAAPSSFIALLLSCARRSGGATQLCYAPRSSAPSAFEARTQPDAADGALFLLPIFSPSRRAFRSFPPRPRASSFFPPPPSFSLSPSRVPELSVVSTFKEGWRRERSRLGLRQIFLFFFSPPPPLSLHISLSLSLSLALPRLLLSSRILFSRSLFIPRISPRAPEWLNTKIIEPGVARPLPSPSPLLPPLNRKNAKKDKQVAVTKE